MELPIELRIAIENEVQNISIKELQQCAMNISKRYRDKSSKKINSRLITSREEAIAYSASRMPATYGSVYTALSHVLNMIDLQKNDNLKMESLLDVGAGTGAGSWAVNSLIDLNCITCLENEDYMINIGNKLMNLGEHVLKDAVWKKQNIITDDIVDKADLVIASYVLNEIQEDKREYILNNLWNATNKILLIIEPGTPEGFREIKYIRNKFLNNNVNIIAPCTHKNKCEIKNQDWCCFSCRIARTRIHKFLKDGESPYEDEKFSYIAFSRFDIKQYEDRILRHPKIESGKITLKLCKNSGNIEEKVVTKKEKELFKIVKKLKCGDIVTNNVN